MYPAILRNPPVDPLQFFPSVLTLACTESAYLLTSNPGNVDITSDDFRAMAQQATYDEKQKKLALSGDEKNKVYLKQGDKVTDRYRYVEVRKLGTQNRLHFKRN